MEKKRTPKQQAKIYFSIFVSSILSGFSISIGVTVYLNLLKDEHKQLGAILFGIGLFTILNFKFYLFTGKVGQILDNNLWFFIDLFICLIGNFVGDIILCYFIKQSLVGENIRAQAVTIITNKRKNEWYSMFILGVMCGIMIYLGVKGYNHCDYPLGKTVFCYLAIQIFILSGYEHCVANLCYYIYAGTFKGRDFGHLMLVVLGNLVGSVIFDGLIKVRDYFLKEDEIIPTKKIEPTEQGQKLTL